MKLIFDRFFFCSKYGGSLSEDRMSVVMSPRTPEMERKCISYTHKHTNAHIYTSNKRHDLIGVSQSNFVLCYQQLRRLGVGLHFWT